MIPESVLGGFLSLVCDRPVSVQVSCGEPDIDVDPVEGQVHITSPTSDVDVMRSFAALGAGRLMDDGLWAQKAWEKAPKKLHPYLRACWLAVAVRVAHSVARGYNAELARRIESGREVGVGRVTSDGDAEVAAVLAYVSSGRAEDRCLIPDAVADRVDSAVVRLGKDASAGFLALARILSKYAAPGTARMSPLLPAAGFAGGDGGHTPSSDSGQHEAVWRPVSTTAAAQRNAIEMMVSRDKVSREPEWHHGVPSGRLNLREVAKPLVDPQTAFSEIRYSNSVPQETVVFIDASLSMRDRIEWATECAWALGGLGDTRWYLFDAEVHPWQLRRKSGSIAVPTVAGGTAPGAEMAAEMDGAGAVVVISDGDFESPREVYTMMEHAVSRGAKLVTMGFDAPVGVRCDDPVASAIMLRK